jgi:exodeoxyribonuclease V alpha subunit
MSDTPDTVDRLRLEPAAAWFGRRLCGTLVPPAPGLALPVAWSLHQWMQGHTCLDLDQPLASRASAAGSFDMLEARPPAAWLEALRTHAAVAEAPEGSLHSVDAPLVLEGSRLFLGRWRQQEIEVARALLDRAAWPAVGCETEESAARVHALVARRARGLEAAQLRAVQVGASRRLAVITGGPGTGKTFVAARVIEAALAGGPRPVLLLAPTGKAAARLQASVREAAASGQLEPEAARALEALQAQTVHAATLRRGGEALRRAQLIVVDETSMIDLERMHDLLRLAHPQATLLLLGDPHQLASVEAGSVLADIVQGATGEGHALQSCVVHLERSRRFEKGSPVARLAEAVNGGHADQAIEILRSQAPGMRWIQVNTPGQVVDASIEAMENAGPGARILCGHRHGIDGALRINAAVERRRGGVAGRRDHPGRPVMITVNDDLTGLRNGDVGEMEQVQGSWFARFEGDMPPVPAARLPAHETAYALTIHKTQGSEYDAVVVALPARPSPVLTRELLYTGFTRTRGGLVVVASEATLRAAVARPIRRSSGLRERLRAGVALSTPAP